MSYLWVAHCEEEHRQSSYYPSPTWSIKVSLRTREGFTLLHSTSMASQKPVKSHALAMRSSRLPKDLDKGKARIKPQANPNVGRHSEGIYFRLLLPSYAQPIYVAGAAQFDYEMLAVPTGEWMDVMFLSPHLHSAFHFRHSSSRTLG